MRKGSRVIGRATVVFLALVTTATGLAVTSSTASANFADELPSANPIDITPRVLTNGPNNVPNSQARSIAEVGNRIVIGGNFTEIQNYNNPTIYDQRAIFAFDPTTGLIDQNFRPVFNGDVTTVLAHPDGDKVYVAGAFSRINGDVHSRVALLNLSNGSPVSTFNPPPISAEVTSMKLANGQLYIGGDFATIGATSRRAMATLNPTTGALTDHMSSVISGTLISGDGVPSVKAFDITPNGNRLVAIGNFNNVDGNSRVQLAMWNTSGATATLQNWATERYGNVCNPVFPTYMRDIDIAPNGKYFVVVTTGSYRGSSTLCDAAARWDFKGTGTTRQPNWTNYTGGDTLTSVEITGPMAYLGGHMRWLNNPYRGDNPGPGAWPTEGLAVLDTRNGLPFSWNPGRDRGLGVFDFLPTNSMLWSVSDTNNWANEYRPRLAGFPFNGNQLPPDQIGRLPGDVWQLGAIPGGGASDQSGIGFDGTTVQNQATEPGNWANVRGAFAVDDTLYTTSSNNTFTAQSWDGSNFGPPQDIELYEGASNLTGYAQNFINDLDNITGIFFEPGRARIYYTMQGSNALYWRPFTPESRLVGPTQRTLGKVGGLTPNRVKGMFLADGYVYFADSVSGQLKRVKLNGNKFAATATTVNTAIDWRSNALFLSSQPATLAVNVDPIADFTADCTGLTCSVNATTSTDADGEITEYSVDFDDGTVMTNPTAQHTYAAEGPYDITVTVTDNRGASHAKTKQVNVAQLPNIEPSAAFTVDCWGIDCDFDAGLSDDSDGVIVDYAWDFGDVNVGSGETANHIYATGGTFNVGLTVTDNRGGTAVSEQEITINEIATNIEFRDSVSVNGGNSKKVDVPVPNTVQADDLLVMYVTNGNTRTADVPAGWTQLGSRTDSDLTTQVFWRFASELSAGSTVTSTLRDGTNAAAFAPVIASLVAYSGVDAAPVSESASAIETSNQAVNNHTTPGVTVPNNGAWVLSYWADRNSAADPNVPTTTWTPPFEQAARADAYSGGGDARVSSLLTDDGGPVLAGVRNGLVAAANAGATKGTMWTVVLRSQ